MARFSNPRHASRLTYLQTSLTLLLATGGAYYQLVLCANQPLAVLPMRAVLLIDT